MKTEKLIFVYNASSGKFSKLVDAAHKILSPKTYSCNLCALTFDMFSENKKWKLFRENSKLQMEFLHTDEFKKVYASKFVGAFTFPVILIENDGQLEVFIASDELNRLKTTDELIGMIEAKKG